jgi:pyruvate/2-oxoglutarate dehydrogenase complex dihydrolipoamide acyltransferase (E2) component
VTAEAAVVVTMPKLADTLVDGTVARWLKQVGDAVREGEPLAAIETDKVSSELVAPTSGTVAELLAPEGQPVPVDSVIARIAPASPASAPPAQPRPADAGPPRVTPLAAKLLAEHGLSPADLAVIAEGRVDKEAVLRYLDARAGPGTQRESPSAPASAPGGVVEPLSPMRRAIAEHMAEARRTIPHGQAVLGLDLTALALWREQAKAAFRQREGAPLTFTVLFVHALARALAAARPAAPIDLGVAVALDRGLIVPVVRHADRLDLAATARAVADLARRARAGQLDLAETRGALMTVTNVGSFGNLAAFPIVPLHQLGILGPGLVEPRPLPLPGPGFSLRLGWRCLLTLVFDRRAFDDLGAERLLRRVEHELAALAA